MSAPNNDELLRQAIEDVRNGSRAVARQKLEKVVEADENSEKGWLWLASVVDTDEEKRICLENVLHINPDNERARLALQALEAKKPPKADEPEIVAGVSRRQFTLIVGIGGAIVALLLVILVVSVSSNNAAMAAETQRAIDSANATSAAILAQTQVAQAVLDQTATQFALAPPSPTIAPTVDRPTLPPTWTPSPEATIPPTIAALPPPIGLTGLLAAWGGRDLARTGYLPVGTFNFDAASGFTRIGTEVGRDVRLYPNGQRIVYTRYDDLLAGTTLEAVNLNGQQIESVPDRWRDSGEVIQNPQMPAISPDGTFIAFVGRSAEGRQQIYTISLVDNTLRNLTNDQADYASPDISPDGLSIIAVRTDNATGLGTDLAVISVTSGGKFSLTTDQDAYLEADPRWTADGSQIVYATAPQNEPNNFDIVVRTSQSVGAPSLLVRNPAADRNPVLSDDGRYLAFASDRSGNWEIYVYDIQTQALSQLTNEPDPNFPGDWWQP